MQVVFVQTKSLFFSTGSLTKPKQNQHQGQPKIRRTTPALMSSSPLSSIVDKPISDTVAAPSPDYSPSNDISLNRDVGRITQLLERDLRFAEQKLQAAKAPNQIAREYWDKQNHPHKDKWDELAHKIEKAGKPRGPQMESFKAWDGTLITKIGERCYKAPDPGRTYLHQEEVRQVICPR